MELDEVMNRLDKNGDKDKAEMMAAYGIKTENNLGNNVTALRKFARKIGRDHSLALELWDTSIRDARLLASFIDEPDMVTEIQLDQWAEDFDSWDVCDTVCGSLFDKTPYLHKKIREWAVREEEFVKRAGFALLAWWIKHDKEASDDEILVYMPLIKKGAKDHRNYVKKGVSWALRHIGKRNKHLNREAIKAAQELAREEDKSARWVGKDALRELSSDKVKARLKA